MRRAHTVLAVAAITALLAGCGSSGSSSSGGGSGKASPALSAAAWKQKINGICASMTAQSNALTKPTTTAQLKPFIQKIVDYANAEIAKIKSVTPPAQFATGQQQVVSDLTTVFGAMQAVLKKPLSATSFAAQLKAPAVQQAARDYVARSRAAGLSSCILATGA
jgi:hypothetical protein